MNLPAALPRIVGAKLPLRPMHVWTIRVRLQIERRVRDLALFDIALDSKLRGCDVVALRLADIMAAGSLRRRATIIQQKTGRPVQFEITRADAPLAHGLAQSQARRRGRLAVSQPDASGRAPVDAPIHPAGEAMGGADRPRASRLWQPQLAANEGLAALSQDGQPQSLPAAARPYQAGEHRPLLGRGAGRRAGAFRRTGNLGAISQST